MDQIEALSTYGSGVYLLLSDSTLMAISAWQAGVFMCESKCDIYKKQCEVFTDQHLISRP